jgi:transposase
MVHRRLEGWKIDEIAEALQVNEKTVDRWCSIHRKHGWEELKVKSHAPHTIHRTPQATVDLVLKLRQEKRWGPCKIAGYLKKHDESVTPISHATVYKILVEANLNNPI